MEPVQTATSTYGPVHFLNIEYFFRLFYNLFHASGDTAGYALFAVHLWEVVTFLAYAASLAFIGIFVYLFMRMKDLEHEDEKKYETIRPAEAEDRIEHSRWVHVAALIESPIESDWRQAIIEADIMLNDILGTHGYHGATVGEKLKQGDPARFRTLNDAWEAHKVRNQIAHEGSAFRLSPQIAYRTVVRYRNVFEEFGII